MGAGRVGWMIHNRPFNGLRVTAYSREATETERSFYGHIVQRLAKRRVELGLTQEELDTQLGVSEGQVAKWESFQRLPGPFLFVCWALELGVSLSVERNKRHHHTDEQP